MLIISENEMGGLRGLERLGGLRRVGVRAAQAEMWDEWDKWRTSRKGVCKMFIFRLSFANCSLILRLTFGERLCDLEV